jgi:hypothetical protein
MDQKFAQMEQLLLDNRRNKADNPVTVA